MSVSLKKTKWHNRCIHDHNRLWWRILIDVGFTEALDTYTVERLWSEWWSPSEYWNTPNIPQPVHQILSNILSGRKNVSSFIFVMCYISSLHAHHHTLTLYIYLISLSLSLSPLSLSSYHWFLHLEYNQSNNNGMSSTKVTILILCLTIEWTDAVLSDIKDETLAEFQISHLLHVSPPSTNKQTRNWFKNWLLDCCMEIENRLKKKRKKKKKMKRNKKTIWNTPFTRQLQ